MRQSMELRGRRRGELGRLANDDVRAPSSIAALIAGSIASTFNRAKMTPTTSPWPGGNEGIRPHSGPRSSSGGAAPARNG